MSSSIRQRSVSRRIAGEEVNNQQSFNSVLQEAYDQLTLSEQRFRELYDHAPDMYHTLDLEGNFLEFNERHVEGLGYAREELEGKNLVEVMPESELPELPARFEALMTSGHICTEALMLKKDGSVLPVEFHARVFPGRDGRPTEIRCIMRDITERKRLEEQLRQAQKMESIGQLAGGVAHDFNNLLTAVMGYAQLGLTTADPSDSTYQYFKHVADAAEKAATLTRQLLAFSRRAIVSPKVINLNDLIAETEKMLCPLIGETIELKRISTPAQGRVKIDPSQLEQVLINLVVNARDAMPGGGKIVIETADVTIDQAQAGSQLDLSPGDYVMLSVTDNGIGMTDEVKARIFEPFFTTKEEGKGTGLGLSMCYGIIKQNNGHISADTEPGRGATFRIYLPRVDEPASVFPPIDDCTPECQGAETVLVVEDDSAVRSLSSLVLREYGYNVLEAAEGEDALRVSQGHAGEIDLVITDVVMPRMGVRELLERLKASRPGIKVIFTSGYTDEYIVHQGVLDPGVEFIQKPFQPIVLLSKVREVLDAVPV